MTEAARAHGHEHHALALGLHAGGGAALPDACGVTIHPGAARGFVSAHAALLFAASALEPIARLPMHERGNDQAGECLARALEFVDRAIGCLAQQGKSRDEPAAPARAGFVRIGGVTLDQEAVTASVRLELLTQPLRDTDAQAAAAWVDRRRIGTIASFLKDHHRRRLDAELAAHQDSFNFDA